MMDSDCYEVIILHYLSPHLIWVEVADQKSGDDAVLEQVGLYGVLPIEMTVDICGSKLKSNYQRSAEWMPAASLKMRNVLSGAGDVFFQPTHIDRRCSIFDDNIHKYGEILIKSRDDKYIKLSQCLIESGLALFDVCLFHGELSVGNINTQLSYTQTQNVIRILEMGNKDRQTKIKRQTLVFQAAQHYESTLTTKNLAKHSNNQVKNADLNDLLEKKMKDLDQCKDVDEVSLGRGITKKTQQEGKKMSYMLKKKLELSKLQKTMALLRDHKLECGGNAQVDKLEHVNFYLAGMKDTLSNNHNLDNVMGEREELRVDGMKNTLLNNHNLNDVMAERDELRVAGMKNTLLNNQKLDDVMDKREELRELSPKQHTKRGRKKHKIIEYDAATENCVAYGPPGINFQFLAKKIVKNENDDQEPDVIVTDIHNRKEVTPKISELYDNVDSNVEMPITNKNVLKEINTQQGTSKKERSDKQFDLIKPGPSAMLQKKLALHKALTAERLNKSLSSNSDTTVKDSSTSEDMKPSQDQSKSGKSECVHSDNEDQIVIEKINAQYGARIKPIKHDKPKAVKPVSHYKINVNPFKNIDDSISVFVDKLVTPILMVHNKMSKRIEPTLNMRDMCFSTHIQVVLKNMLVQQPMMLQMISWPVILRGFSLFLVSPLGSGKTLGYLPAVCRLVSDYNASSVSVGPIAIIVCATAQSVTEVDRQARMFLGLRERAVCCYPGIDELSLTTSLLNGCDLLICTPSVLTRLLRLPDYGVDLTRLSTFVLDDAERLAKVYMNDVKYFIVKINEMYKHRINKEHMVQYIVASRVWCDFMEPLARKACNSVVCIGAFQECVLYSKAHTSVEFVQKRNKVSHVLEFLKEIDVTKRTVIVCRSDDEVEELSKAIIRNKHFVFTANSTMTVEDLYKLNLAWADYEEPLLGPVLICCDGNLTHLNVTNAHYLVHYSLPPLYSMFCKRFSILNDNYSSIFKNCKNDVKIKVFIDDDNVEQLPKILNFVKRCTANVPEFLSEVCEKILKEKDSIKGKKLIPVCDSLLLLGECADVWGCIERHTIFKKYDEPKVWVPRSGIITFKVLHYHSAVHYSARLLSNIMPNSTQKYPQTYSTLSIKLGTYFSKASNQRLHGLPKVGDICAVSIKQNFFARCQVLKVLSHYDNGTPNSILIKLIDELKLEKTKDIYLYHLPEELKAIETHIIEVRLANIKPKDNDVTFSQLAKNELRKMTEKVDELYMRGRVVLAIGNCVFVDTLEACQKLTSLKENIVLFDFRKELLDSHGILNSNHVTKLKAICDYECNGAIVESLHSPEERQPEVEDRQPEVEERQPEVEERQPEVEERRPEVIPEWAYLDDEFCAVYLSHVENPRKFFVLRAEFEPRMTSLANDIDKYVESDPKPVTQLKKGKTVLAKLPYEDSYERALIYDILDNNKVECFCVDHGDTRQVSVSDLLQIPRDLVSQIPFQAVECSLAGVRPAGEYWSDFGTNWFRDKCYEGKKAKQLFVKYFTQENGQIAGMKKYTVALVDTSRNQDDIINNMLIDLNLAQENTAEIHYLDNVISVSNESENRLSQLESVEDINVNDSKSVGLSQLESLEDMNVNDSKSVGFFQLESLEDKNVNESQSVASIPDSGMDEHQSTPLKKIDYLNPIQSAPLVESDDDYSDNDWDIMNPKKIAAMFFPGIQKYNNKLDSDLSNSNIDPLPNVEANDNCASAISSNCLTDEQLHLSEPKPSNGLTVTLPREVSKPADATNNCHAATTISDYQLSNDEPKIYSQTSTITKSHSVSMNALKSLSTTLDSDDFSSDELAIVETPLIITESKMDKRKPKLVWHQNKSTIFVKIQLIGAEKYDLEIKENSLSFSANLNDTEYAFDMELYGVVDGTTATHSNKGLYILIKLDKVLKKNWLTLSKRGALDKWIIYDADSIDTSSEEEEKPVNPFLEAAQIHHPADVESDSDDDFLDDVNYDYKRH